MHKFHGLNFPESLNFTEVHSPLTKEEFTELEWVERLGIDTTTFLSRSTVSQRDNNHYFHPVKIVRPNGQLAVNCTAFGCYFLLTPEFFRVFLWKVLDTVINIIDHFCMIMKFSAHEACSELSYPDHSRRHNINLHCNLQLFLT